MGEEKDLPYLDVNWQSEIDPLRIFHARHGRQENSQRFTRRSYAFHQGANKEFSD